MKVAKGEFSVDHIVTADLESLLMKDNTQLCYMAAWYKVNKEGVATFKVFDISEYNNNPFNMLKQFWNPLLSLPVGVQSTFIIGPVMISTLH
jgi:hypothetical protein